MSACVCVCVRERGERQISVDFITLINSVSMCVFFIMFSSVPAIIKVLHLRRVLYVCVCVFCISNHVSVSVCVCHGGFTLSLITAYIECTMWNVMWHVCAYKCLYAFTFLYVCILPCSFNICCKAICQNPKRTDWLSRCAGNATISIITYKKNVPCKNLFTPEQIHL